MLPPPRPFRSLAKRRPPQDPELLGFPPHLDNPEGACGPDRRSHGRVLRKLALPVSNGIEGGRELRDGVNGWLDLWLEV